MYIFSTKKSCNSGILYFTAVLINTPEPRENGVNWFGFVYSCAQESYWLSLVDSGLDLYLLGVSSTSAFRSRSSEFTRIPILFYSHLRSYDVPTKVMHTYT